MLAKLVKSEHLWIVNSQTKNSELIVISEIAINTTYNLINKYWLINLSTCFKCLHCNKILANQIYSSFAGNRLHICKHNWMNIVQTDYIYRSTQLV